MPRLASRLDSDPIQVRPSIRVLLQARRFGRAPPRKSPVLADGLVLTNGNILNNLAAATQFASESSHESH